MKYKSIIRTVRSIVTLTMLILAVCNVKAFTFQDESLDYKVMYKWGLVNKQAGHATLSIKAKGDTYQTRLVAASESWADHFFKVRDTLAGEVTVRDFRPLVYRKMAHEGGERRYDTVKFTYSGNIAVGDCSRQKWDKSGKKTRDEKRTLTAQGLTMDMLTSFYFMRSRPYSQWQKGHKQSVNLFSGKRKEILTITYHGIEKITVDNREYTTYHITFTFTDPSKPSKTTDDPMDAWISTGADRIPIKLEGKLKVGKVQCFYVP